MLEEVSTPAPPPAKKRRVYKALPPALKAIGPKDLSKFSCAVEVQSKIDGTVNEASVAQYIEVDDNKINLKKDLNLDQLRKLCRNVGVKINSSANKFQCLKNIAIWTDCEGRSKETGTHLGSTEARVTTRGSTANCESSLSGEEESSARTNKTDQQSDEKSIWKKAYESIDQMTQHAANIYDEMKAANEETKRNNKLQATIELAKALGDQSVLRDLLQQQLQQQE